MNKLSKIVESIHENKNGNLLFFLLILISLSIFMLQVNKPYPEGDDFYTHFYRLEGLIQAMRDGNFPWYIDYNGLNGYGYFLKAFYCDILLTPFAAIGLLTGTMTAYKIMLVTITVLCGGFTYMAVVKMYSNRNAAFVAGLLFAFCSYRLLDLFHRAAIGETFTFTFLPLVLWGLYEIIHGNYKKWYVLAIGYSLIIFSHLLSSVMLTIPIVLLLLMNFKKLKNEPKRLLYLCYAAIATLVITAYFVAPLLEQMMSNIFYYETHSSIPDKMKSSIYFTDLINGMLQGITPEEQAFFPKIGIFLILAIGLRFFVTNKNSAVKSADKLAILGLILLLMTSRIFPWHIYPFRFFNVIQFPWRLMIYPSLMFAIAGGIYITNIKISKNRFWGIMLIFIFFSFFLIKSEAKNYKNQISQRSTNITYTLENGDVLAYQDWQQKHYGYCEYLPSKVPSYNYPITMKQEGTEVKNFKNVAGVITMDIETKNSNQIELPLTYYKGYKAHIDGEEINIEESPNGLIEIPIEDSGKLTIHYAGTAIQKMSTIISILAILGLTGFIYLFNRKRTK